MYLVLVEFLSRFRYLEDCWHDFFVGMIFFSSFFLPTLVTFSEEQYSAPLLPASAQRR